MGLHEMPQTWSLCAERAPFNGMDEGRVASMVFKTSCAERAPAKVGSAAKSARIRASSASAKPLEDDPQHGDAAPVLFRLGQHTGEGWPTIVAMPSSSSSRA